MIDFGMTRWDRVSGARPVPSAMRWAIKAGGQNVFPVSIEALVQYLLHRDHEPKGCPRSLPGSVRSAVTTVYARLKIGPVPDFADAIWNAQAAKIK